MRSTPAWLAIFCSSGVSFCIPYSTIQSVLAERRSASLVMKLSRSAPDTAVATLMKPTLLCVNEVVSFWSPGNEKCQLVSAAVAVSSVW